MAKTYVAGFVHYFPSGNGSTLHKMFWKLTVLANVKKLPVKKFIFGNIADIPLTALLKIISLPCWLGVKVSLRNKRT